MPKIVWDRVDERTYQNGLDRGVIYLPDGSAVPWNGLTSVDQSSEFDKTTVYYDGMKIHDIITPGEYNATISAVTFPNDFSHLLLLRSMY